jgi:flavin-dependent dehydrogenase
MPAPVNITPVKTTPVETAPPATSAVKTVAIIGGGPAGSALATLLVRRNYKVGIFHTDKRPPLIVGESLLPAVIPMLRELGVEEQVKSFSIYKPGATVCLKVDEIVTAPFENAKGNLPPYAYNTDRALFDQAILDGAEKAGARVFRFSSKIEKGPQPGTVQLSAETLERTEGFFGQAPDLIVDATGRLRTIAKVLDLPAREGGRKDVALFAHHKNVTMTDTGHIHLDHLTCGWSWRIPLPERVSLGIVIHPDHLQKFGSDLESQYDGYLKSEPSLRQYTQGASRITPVVRYNNYQLISEKMYGPGWAMIGDAAGFLDPVFSTGLYLGMKSAFEFAKAMDVGTERALQKYQDNCRWELKMWQRVVSSWYSGVLFNLYRAGQAYKDHPIGRRIAPRVEKRLGRIFTGEAINDRVNMTVFEWLISLGTVLRDHKDLAVV